MRYLKNSGKGTHRHNGKKKHETKCMWIKIIYEKKSACFIMVSRKNLKKDGHKVNKKNKPIKTFLSSSIALLITGSVNAGGFSLYTEGSAVAVGNFAAGSAAEAADASTSWYNPAGLAFLNKRQLVVSGVGVFPSTEISGTSTFRTQGLPPYIQTFSGLQGGENALVPATHYAHPLGDRLVAGISIVAPFGLATEYPRSSPVRYGATRSEIMTVNVAPTFGYRLTDNVSVGGGLDLQWAKVKFNAMLGVPTLGQFSLQNPRAFDSSSENSGDSFGVGFHAGVLSQFNQGHTRLGINYQSKMAHQFMGSSVLTGVLADPFLENPSAVFHSDGLISNPIELPDVITLSAYQDITNNLALLGSIVYTGWDVFKATQLINVAAWTGETGQTTLNVTTPQGYRNAWRFAAGANYRLTDQWLLRFGGGYDQTPTVNAERDIRLPDANRWALSVGAHYQMNPALGFDAGYTYLFAAQDPSFNKTQVFSPVASYNVRGEADVHAHLVGLQAVWTMDTVPATYVK